MRITGGISEGFWLGVCCDCQHRFNQPIPRWQCSDYRRAGMFPNDWPPPKLET